MGFCTKASILAAALLATAAQGHMIMKTPVPYGKATLNNSPLEPDGSDFPCKQRSGVYVKDGAPNVMAIGEQQTLSFTGSAVHGGGSCQIALSTDTQPTKDSKWMVIKSIIGGCPASVPGNLPEDANGSGASTFQYSIPDGIAPGEYALSWTWFNKVGNREMYQNCASVSVTPRVKVKKRYAPAPKSVKRQASFPDLFRCNLGDGCVTPANVDIIFPNPGADVQSVGAGPFSQMPGGAGGAAGQGPPQTQATATPAETQAPSEATTPPAYNGGQGGGPAATATGFASGFGGNGGNNGSGGNGGSNGSNGGGGGLYTVSAGNFAEGASSQSPVTPVTIETPAPTAAADSGNSFGGCEVGSWDCQDSGTSFRRCVSGGTWSATIDMAAGTKCVPGISANFAEVVGKVKKRHHSHHFRFLDSFH